MINEFVETEKYLRGENINKKNLYRIVYMITKEFINRGMAHSEIRDAVFRWGKDNGVYIKYDVNSIIYKALEDKTPICNSPIVKINNGDIVEIKKRFDSKNARLTALAILCYAKARADKDRLFNISSNTLANWIGIGAGNLRGRYIKELIDFGYLSKIETPRNTYKWDGDNTTCKYSINVELHNSGNYTLIDNKILDLYSELF